MIHLAPEQTATLRNRFLPERPGPLIGRHVIHSGHGSCFVDRWPEPKVILVETAGNYALLGDAQAVSAAELQPRIKGFVETSEDFRPLLKAAFPDVQTWPRIIFSQQNGPDSIPASEYSLRRLEPSDVQHLDGLSSDSSWISKTWGGSAGLAASGLAWGVFVAGQLASVACTFFLGETYEDIGVITEPGFRGLGLSPLCAGALCNDIRARRHQPSWTTSPDNVASTRVAEKLGFVIQRHDLLYAVGVSIPEPASNE